MNAVPLPRATYRLQLTPDFGVDAAREVLPYLVELGVSHVYLSPCLQATDGSSHGYDGVDPGRVDAARGGEAAFEQLLRAASELELGVVLDVVPNHLAASEQNPWWRDVLTHGRDSAFAGHFDIDWEPPDPELRGRVLLPILGEPLDDALAHGAIEVVDGGESPSRIRVHGARELPLRPGSWPARGPVDLRSVLDEQHYLLTFWRDGLKRLNWRRFFDITELVGVRVEDPRVFDDVHRRVLEWHRRGLVHGLRIDHPDGLRDPGGYARQLRRAAPGAWIVLEKILEPAEELPLDWPVDGTTGYDFLAAATGLFVDRDGERPLSELCREVTGACPPFWTLRRDKKRLAVRELFSAETGQVVRLFAEAWADPRSWREAPRDDDALRRAIEAVVVAMPVYRTYVPEHGRADDRARRWLDAAFERAAAEDPELDPLVLARLRGLLTGDDDGGAPGAELRARFQQLTGPAMAKGLEDTALYCDRRLVCVNEVGSDPEHFGTSRDTFHELCAELQRHWPATMTALSTHDSKRSADVRVRIATLSEVPQRWASEVRVWRQLVARHRAAPNVPLPGAEYLLFQTLVGCWPAEPDRIAGYLRKAAREAKLRTSWLDPDPDYEEALDAFARAALADREFVDRVEAFVARILPAARVHGLSLQLLQLTAVGIPDIYQGCETWRESLTDPDNRRAVDFAALRQKLSGAVPLDAAGAWAAGTAIAKLWLTQRTLSLRAERPHAFGPDAPHVPLPIHGADERHAIAFRRGDDVAVVVPRFLLVAGERPLDFQVQLPEGAWYSAWDGRPVGSQPDAAALFARFPVALLINT